MPLTKNDFIRKDPNDMVTGPVFNRLYSKDIDMTKAPVRYALWTAAAVTLAGCGVTVRQGAGQFTALQAAPDLPQNLRSLGPGSSQNFSLLACYPKAEDGSRTLWGSYGQNGNPVYYQGFTKDGMVSGGTNGEQSHEQGRIILQRAAKACDLLMGGQAPSAQSAPPAAQDPFRQLFNSLLRAERKQRQEMLKRIKRHDKMLTI